MIAVADMPHPARCPGCGAGVELTLAADPSTPVYQCGSTPYRVVCVQAATLVDWTDTAAPTVRRFDANVRVLDADERRELRTLFLAIAPEVNAPRLALCTTPGCGKVAIDGRCIDE